MKELICEIEEKFKGKPFLTNEDIMDLLGCEITVIKNWNKRPNKRRRPPRLSVGNEPRYPKRAFVDWLVRNVLDVENY